MGADIFAGVENTVGLVAGIIFGVSASKVHRVVDGGVLVTGLAGLLGGWWGQMWWAADLTARFDGLSLAGHAVAGALGGALLGVLAGAAWRIARPRIPWPPRAD